jgi:hypothetical protein
MQAASARRGMRSERMLKKFTGFEILSLACSESSLLRVMRTVYPSGAAMQPLRSRRRQQAGRVRRRRTSGGGLFGAGAVAGVGRCAFLHALEQAGEGGVVHGQDTFAAGAFEQAVDGGIVEHEPVGFGGDIDVAEADLLGVELELCAAVGPFALLDEAFLMEEKKAAANHDGALGESLRNLRRGVHGVWFRGQHREDS